MKTVIAKVESDGNVVLENAEIGEPDATEVLVQGNYSTLSPGTESSLLAGDILPLPQYIGYSLAGTVVKVGSDVTEYQAGDRVVATAKHATYQNIDQRLLTPVPEGVSLEHAAFFNLAHTALYGVRRSGLQLGEAALVMGQGLVGAITAQLARLAGAVPVIVTDIDEERLEVARSSGAHHAINAETQADELHTLVSSLGRGGIPVVFEATGRRQPLEQAVEFVGERGRVMMMSTVHGDVEPRVSNALMMKGAVLIGGYVNSKPFALHRTDLTIGDSWPPVVAKGTTRYSNRDIWTSDDDIRTVLNLIQHGSLDLEALISHRFSVEDIPGAYQLVANNDRSLLGGVIDWNQ